MMKFIWQNRAAGGDKVNVPPLGAETQETVSSLPTLVVGYDKVTAESSWKIKESQPIEWTRLLKESYGSFTYYVIS